VTAIRAARGRVVRRVRSTNTTAAAAAAASAAVSIPASSHAPRSLDGVPAASKSATIGTASTLDAVGVLVTV
jgi:hypothetical protein